MSIEQELADAARFARDAYRRGSDPSIIVFALYHRFEERLGSFNSIAFVRVAMLAFHLPLSEAKCAEGFDPFRRTLHADAFDTYMIPRIEARRSSWDVEE